MANLDRPHDQDIRAASAIDIAPRRQFSRKLRAAGKFTHEDMHVLAEEVLRRIMANRSHHAAGSFVLGDTDRNVYVLSEGANVTRSIVEASLPWYVGSYAMRSVQLGVRLEFPTVQEIIDDLVEHFRTLQPLHLTIEVAP